MNKIKTLETFGTVCGMVGAFLVAMKYGNVGYPFFFCSSLALLVTACYNRQKNFVALHVAFFAANVIGVFNYV